MKKYILPLFILLAINLLSCSSDSNDHSNPQNKDSVGGSLATFILKGDYLYVVDDISLNVFSIANVQNPVKVNTVSIGFGIETLYSLDDYLFIGSQNGMFIYEITNPENPKKLSATQHFTACDPVVANHTHAFVTLHSTTNCGSNINVLQVYDIADLENPMLVHQRGLTYPRGLALIGNNHLAVCDDELKFFSIENPEEPKLIYSVNTNYKDLIYHNNILFAFGENEITQYQWNADDFSDLKTVSKLTY
ncbi:MAG: hypothetical protein Q4G08_11335 [Capnocytophaga sp.]|nr:hypothetical protein [Capnocytophaga sp.]